MTDERHGRAYVDHKAFHYIVQNPSAVAVVEEAGGSADGSRRSRRGSSNPALAWPWGSHACFCEGLWGRAFLTAYNSANDGERLRMAEGLGKGAGLALLAVPMVEAFTFTQAQFQRILSNYLGLEGAISVPHTHHCGGGVNRRRDACPHARDGKSSASMPSAWEEFSST